MKLFSIQFIKDFMANFGNFNAYIILAGYYILSVFSAVYLGDYFLRETDIMNAFFVMQPVILIFVIPSITMRTWAEEIKTGTIELLLTQPIGYFTLVIAKFFASFAFFLLLLSTSLFLGYFSNLFSIMDIGIVVWGYIGVILVGGLFTAIGVCVSVFNKNNILSYITTIFILFSITQMTFTNIGNVSLTSLNFEDNFIAFLSGTLSVSNVLYFIIGGAFFLWINLLGIYFRKIDNIKEKIYFVLFLGFLILYFIYIQISSWSIFDKQFDVTAEKKFTLQDETIKILKNIDKRIDITLYLSQNAREDANSSFSVFADFMEKTLKQFERASEGSVRTNTVLVQPFGELERKLIREGVSFEEDKLGYKKFVALEITDNEGNFNLLKTFSSLRQNLFETDLIRIIQMFGNEKKKIAFFVADDDLKKMPSFNGLLNEFYDVTQIKQMPLFILPTYDAVILFKTSNISSENLLALEQYVLRGGNLIIIDEFYNLATYSTGKHIINFLDNFGIEPKTLKEPVLGILDNKPSFIGPSLIVKNDLATDVRSVLINEAGEVRFSKSDNSITSPILNFGNKNIAVVSEGKYISNYLDLAIDNTEILPSSIKDGKIFFIYDTDLFMDYIYISDETKSNYFYDTILAGDNQLFILRLLDYATNSQIEKKLRYRNYKIKPLSIGNSVLSGVKQKYSENINQLEEIIKDTINKKDNFYELLTSRGYASVKNIGK